MNVDVTELAEHLQRAPHTLLGLTPAPLRSNAPQAAVLRDRSMNAFHASLTAAQEQWPDQRLYALIGAEDQRGDHEDIAGLACLIAPQELMQFDGANTPAAPDLEP